MQPTPNELLSMPYSERIKYLPLPEGWRWLQVGEYFGGPGVIHDPRIRPCDSFGTWRITEQHHAVRVRVNLEASRGVILPPSAKVENVASAPARSIRLE